jgi:hypothetical protein
VFEQDELGHLDRTGRLEDDRDVAVGPVGEPGAVQQHPPTVAGARTGAGRARVVPGARASGPGGHGQHGQRDRLPDRHVVVGVAR